PPSPAFTPPGAAKGPSLNDLFTQGGAPPAGSPDPFQPSFNAAMPGNFAPPPPRAAGNDPFAAAPPGSDPFAGGGGGQMPWATSAPAGSPAAFTSNAFGADGGKAA